MATKPNPRIPTDTPPRVAPAPSQGPALSQGPAPSQPLRSKPESSPPNAAEGDPQSQKEFDPFRFAVTELPTGMRQQLIATKLPVVPVEQLFDTKPPNARIAAPIPNSSNAPVSSPVAEQPESFRLPLRTNRILLLFAVLIVALGFAVVFTLKGSDTDARVVLPNEAPPGGHTKPPGSTQAATSLPNGTPVAPAVQSPSAVPALAKPERPTDCTTKPKELTAPNRPSNGAIHAQSAPSPRPTAPEVPATPKKESALGSVLAPPPD